MALMELQVWINRRKRTIPMDSPWFREKYELRGFAHALQVLLGGILIEANLVPYEAATHMHFPVGPTPPPVVQPLKVEPDTGR